MTERLLQFIWQFQHFNKGSLVTWRGERLEIIHPGTINYHQGPDFLDARIKIGDIQLAGTIELHVLSSGWEKHRHSLDRNYANVILHVVWQHDRLEDPLPVLELNTRVSGLLLQRFETLMTTPARIPCAHAISKVPEITWEAWKQRMVTEKLLRKKTEVQAWLEKNNNHWEEICWRLIARNFGMKVNADAFARLAGSIPLKQMSRLAGQPLAIEALLFGQAGLLDGKFRDAHARNLQKEYRFLAHKLGCRMLPLPLYFLRMRPVNFPTVRLAQLAALINRQPQLFAAVRDAETTSVLKEFFSVTPPSYWDRRYRFDEPSAKQPKAVGTAFAENVVINTAVPLVFSYGQFYDDERYINKSYRWLLELPPEKNKITRMFQELGLAMKSAQDTQAMTELFTHYCTDKRCLDCAVGNWLLRQSLVGGK